MIKVGWRIPGPAAWLDAMLRRNAYDEDGVARIGSRRIYILPTSTGATFGAMLFATLLGSLNYQNNLGLFLTFLMAGIALVSMHHCWYNLLGLSVRCADAAPCFCGETARFIVELWDRRGRPHGEVCLREAGCRTVATGVHATIALALPTEQRGHIGLGELLIETRYPLGLFRAWALVRTPAAVLVYPRPAAQAPAPGWVEGLDQQIERARDRSRDRGVDDFLGLRTYRPGDSPRQIDWKALAREHGLLTKEFAGDQAARVQLDLDQHRGDLETRLSLLTRQLLDAEGRRLRYGLKLGATLIAPGQGEAHRRRCLEALALYPADPAAESPGPSA